MAIEKSPAGKRADKRRSVRFKPDMGSFVFVQLEPKNLFFHPSVSGLTVDEAHRGCSFVCLSAAELKKGVVVRIKTGELAPLMGEVRWVKKLTPRLMHVGVQYFE